MSVDIFDLDLVRALDAQPNESLLEAARRVVAERDALRRAVEGADEPVREAIRRFAALPDPAAKGLGALRTALWNIDPTTIRDPWLAAGVIEWRNALHQWSLRRRCSGSDEDRAAADAEFRAATRRLADAIGAKP